MSDWRWYWMGFALIVRVSWPWRYVSVGFAAALEPGHFHHFYLGFGCLEIDLSHDRDWVP